jgi:GAF domain-containing protein
MNTERLLREVEKRLGHLAGPDRAEVLDAVREEIGRERRRGQPAATVEVERERRTEAEMLRDVLEAISRQGSLEDTIVEVLKQLARVVVSDSSSIALLEPDGAFRVFASRGLPDPERIRGFTYRNDLSEMLRRSRAPIALADVSADDRFTKAEATPVIRSWAGVPLLVEGDVIGLLSLDRHAVAAFDEEDLHRAKAVAFSAAAAIRKAQLLDKLRRYATLMERVVRVDDAVFAGVPLPTLARVILEGALRMGYPAGAFLLRETAGLKVAASPDGALLPEGADAPAGLDVAEARHLDAEESRRVVGDRAPRGLFVVPLEFGRERLGTLVLADPDGETPDDRLVEAYASRAAAAYAHASSR